MPRSARIKYLPTKLLAVRKQLGLSQSQLAQRLNFTVYYGRVSDYELGKREPNVLMLLSYARLAGITIDDLVDDKIELKLES